MTKYLFLLSFGFMAAFGVTALTPKNSCAQQSTPPENTSTGGSSSSGGGTIAKQTCDTQVWKTMEARSHIEMEREMMQNQNLIFKPDSILNYVCFDKFAGHAAEHVGPLFTHTTYWDGKEIIQWGKNGSPYWSMDKSMQSVVIDSMKPYIEGNFKHAYLGGRGQFLSLSNPVVTDISGKGGTYACSTMSQVWSKAKCLNFIHTQDFATTDGFYPFINLKAESGGEDVAGYETHKDTRKFPTACDGEPITSSTWKDKYRMSRNEEDFGKVDKVYQYGTPLNRAFTEVRKFVEPGQCSDPIKTGVKVILSPTGKSSPYPDGVCTNPGCTLSANGASCTSTSGGT